MAADGAMPAASADMSTATPAPAAETPPPPGEMSALYPRIGTWKVVIRTLPGGDAAKQKIDHGVMTIKKGPGGFSVVQDFWSRGDSGHTVGQSYTWWDVGAKAYKSVWCDNMQGCTEFTTQMSGNSWTVELDGQADGKKVHTTIHAVMSKDQSVIHETTANAYDGAPAVTETISHYQRESASAATTHGR